MPQEKDNGILDQCQKAKQRLEKARTKMNAAIAEYDMRAQEYDDWLDKLLGGANVKEGSNDAVQNG